MLLLDWSIDTLFDTEMKASQRSKSYAQNEAATKTNIGSTETHHFHSTPKHHYRQIYFQTIDAATNCIKERFDQLDYCHYAVLQELFLNAIKDQPWENEVKEVCSTYGDDIDWYSYRYL